MPRGKAIKRRSNKSVVEATEDQLGGLPAIPLSRRALGDVSNQSSTGEDGKNKDNKRSLRRSRRRSSESNGGQDPAEKQDATANVSIQPSGARGKKQIARSSSHLRALSDKKPPAATQTKRRHDDLSDIDDMLMEPKPRKRRPKMHGQIKKRALKSQLDVGEIRTLNCTSMPSNSAMLERGGTVRCPDFLDMSKEDHLLFRRQPGPFDAAKYTTGISVFDEKNQHDVNEVASYVTDIFQRLFVVEATSRPNPLYLESQPEINSSMRAILIDWIVEVHMKFQLLPDTLYLCVSIIDRFLERRPVERKGLQLVGVTALFIACKYEEIYPPEVRDCVYITDRAYTRQDILDMEVEIVKSLSFKLSVPTGYPFLQRFLRMTDAPKVVADLASYYLERMLQEYCMLNFRGSLVAAAAVSLAWSNPGILEEIPEALPGVPAILLVYTGFEEEEIKEVSKVMSDKICGRSNSAAYRRPLDAVRKKYETDRYCNASLGFEDPHPAHLEPMY